MKKVVLGLLWISSLILVLFAFDTSFSERNHKLEWSELGLKDGYKCLMIYNRINEGHGRLSELFCVGDYKFYLNSNSTK